MGKAPDMLKLAGFVDARKRGIKIQIWFFGSLGSCASQRHTNRKDPQKAKLPLVGNLPTKAMRAFGAQLLPEHDADEGNTEALLETIFH